MRNVRFCLPVLAAAAFAGASLETYGQSYTVSIEQASATWPAGTNYGGFISTSDDPAGPFADESVHFRGSDSGGEDRVYRYRIDFDSEVILHHIVVEGAAWAGGASMPVDVIRVFDVADQLISELDALAGSSSFQSVQVPAYNAIGQTFFLEEVNGDDVWRYRSSIQVHASLRPVEVWVDDDWIGCTPGAAVAGHTCGLDAFGAIQSAIDAVGTPGTVNVAAGRYVENVNFNGKGVVVASEQGPDVTIIDGAGGTVVTFESGEELTSVLRGFTLENGVGTHGAGVAVLFCSPTIESNVIRSNSGSIGSAINVNGGSPHIVGNLIEDNTAGGSGFLITAGIAIINSSSPLIENNIIVNNGPGGGLAMSLPDGAAPVIINNTIIGNIGGGIRNNYYGSLTIKNNIIAGNTEFGGIFTDFGDTPIATYNDLWNNSPSNYGGVLQDLTGTNGNISADPLFVDPTSGDYHIATQSPAVDSGTNDGAPPEDYDGNDRPMDATGDGIPRTDMGAFELVGPFDDVPPYFWAVTFIERLSMAGITAGCGNNNFCPDAPASRAQMAVFLERGMNGSGFSPPAATGNVFLDVGAQDFAASFIEQLASDGITAGCGNNNYCPDATVTRDQMAVFLLRAKHGSGYSPPAPTGVFGDVDLSHWAAAWIEQLAVEGITVGCGNGNYCPEAEVTRDQMAVFLVRTFGL